MNSVIYPVSRLLANPRIFFAIANYLEGPDGETLKEAFYDMLEHHFDDEPQEELEFEPEEICIRINENEDVEMVFDTGLACVLNRLEGEFKTLITNDHEMSATSAIYARIITAIEEANPEFIGNIALVSPPTPGNGYLRSPDGNQFEGHFHLLSDPDTTFRFVVEIIDVTKDILKANYYQIFHQP